MCLSGSGIGLLHTKIILRRIIPEVQLPEPNESDAVGAGVMLPGMYVVWSGTAIHLIQLHGSMGSVLSAADRLYGEVKGYFPGNFFFEMNCS